MTPHKYPAVLLPSEVESIEQAIAAQRSALTQAYVSAREWERQAKQLSTSLNNERAANAKALAEYEQLLESHTRLQAALGEAERQYQEKVSELIAATNERDYWRREHNALFKSGAGERIPAVSLPSTPIEDTQVGRCPRCGRLLDNIAPGISIIAGDIQICTPCLNPGETEVARAKSVLLTKEATE